jgi:uncharacterized membrane-anchored protein YhcB (DUF1043 family)
MGRVIVLFLIAALVIGLVTRNVVRAKRRRQQAQSEINKHPERLDQMLDPTDDA